MSRKAKHCLLQYRHAQVSSHMPYRARQSQRARSGHPGGVGDKNLVETVWKSAVSLVITGCFTSGRETQSSEHMCD